MTWNMNELLTVLFHFTLFGLLLIKLRTLGKAYIIPMIVSLRKELVSRWYHLQEEHSVVVTKKKQLATQFLRQEKQLALLSSKLETWYKAVLARQEKEKQFFIKQNEKIARLFKEQQKRVTDAQRCKKLTKQALAELKKELASKGQCAQREKFLHETLKAVHTLNPAHKGDA